MKVKVMLKGTELVKGLELRIYRNSIKGTFVKREEGKVFLKLEGSFQHVVNEEGLSVFPENAEFEVLEPISFLKKTL